jgi:hypothetical protein
MKKLKENEKDQLVSKLIQYLLLKDGYNPDVEDSFDNFVNEHHVIKKTKDSKKKNSIKLAIDKQKRKLIAGAAILGAFIPTYLMLNTATLKDGDNSKYIEKILYQPDPFTFTNELLDECKLVNTKCNLNIENDRVFIEIKELSKFNKDQSKLKQTLDIDQAFSGNAKIEITDK